MKIFFLKAAVLAFSSALLFTACNKDDDGEEDAFDTRSTSDNSSANSEWDDINGVMQTVMEAAEDQSTGGLKITETFDVIGALSPTDCDEASVNTVAKTITITFTGDCVCNDGRTRSGEIEIAYTDLYRETGAEITTTVETYTVNDIQVVGQKKVTNNGPNLDGHLEFTVEVGNVGLDGGYSTITYPSGSSATWRSERTRVWVEGDDTPLNPLDDIYHIYGTADGTNRNGLDYAMNVPQADPLVYDLSCLGQSGLFPKSGELTISPVGLADRVVDYSAGSGECNRTVRVTVSGFTFLLLL